MITTTIKAVFKRLPFRWYEVLCVGMLLIGAGVIWYQSTKIDTLDEKLIIADEAIASTLLVNELMSKRQHIDQSVVLDWMSAREAYRTAQRKIIDTTFLDYFNIPEESSDVVVPNPPTATTPTVPSTTPVVAPPTPVMSDRQLDVLSDGMWDIYCQTGVDDPGCLP